jgi:hypothetical protein
MRQHASLLLQMRYCNAAKATLWKGHPLAREAKANVINEMETYPMKSQLSFIAIVLIAATTVLGFATVGPMRATNSPVTIPVRVSDSVVASPAPRVYCYSGIKGKQGGLYRGWICEPEGELAVTN